MSDLASLNSMSLSNGLSNSLGEASSYTDFKALAELRAKVTNGSSEKSEEATKEVAKQFESIFLQMMLKSMRDATYVDENNESDQTRFYQEMFDKQIALNLSNRENGGIGLAKIMEQQMSGGVQKKAEADSVEHSFDNSRTHFNHAASNNFSGNSILSQQFEKANLAIKTNESASLSDVVSGVKAKESWTVASPEEFTQALWPHAKQVADRLGVKPEVLIAQAALETGWGDKMIKDSVGNNAHNLFGIKADARWQGERVNVSTLEFRDGVAVKEQASFRSYDSLAQSFDDYANFLQSNPRYQDALAQTADADKFLAQLQQAGYSTDPAYAEKIQSITNRNSFVQTVNDLRNHEGVEKTLANEQMASLSQTWGGNK